MTIGSWWNIFSVKCSNRNFWLISCSTKFIITDDGVNRCIRITNPVNNKKNWIATKLVLFLKKTNEKKEPLYVQLVINIKMIIYVLYQ